MPTLLFIDIGPMEFLVIAAAAVMLFGGDLPDVMRRAGQWVAKLRGMASEITRTVNLPDDVTRLPGAAPDIARQLQDLHREATADLPDEHAPPTPPTPPAPPAGPAPSGEEPPRS